MRCSACGQDAVVVIEMRIGGEIVTFRRCGECEANVWEASEGELSLEEVLELARTDP